MLNDPALWLSRVALLKALKRSGINDFSVWEGMEVKGVVVHTFSRGTHLWADGDLRSNRHIAVGVVPGRYIEPADGLQGGLPGALGQMEG